MKNMKFHSASSSIELGENQFVANISCLYPVYERGEAYLAAGQGRESAAEFQKILDHTGIVWNCWTGALTHLGIARANALEFKSLEGADADAARTRALAAYKDFLALWKDADSDVPLLRQAKAEYANLQQPFEAKSAIAIRGSVRFPFRTKPSFARLADAVCSTTFPFGFRSDCFPASAVLLLSDIGRRTAVVAQNALC